MILLIIKSYLTILLSVGLGSLCIFVIGVYWIINIFSQSKTRGTEKLADHKTGPVPLILTDKSLENEKNDISAIAGDDYIATQLDLARAYIETGSHQLAKKMLEQVMEQGSDTQRKEAQTLLGFM